MLFTKEIEQKLQAQYRLGSDLEKQVVVCKVFHVFHPWTWYILNQDPNDPDYLWAIVDGFEVEIGSVSKRELEETQLVGLHFERDKFWKPRNAEEVFRELIKKR